MNLNYSGMMCSSNVRQCSSEFASDPVAKVERDKCGLWIDDSASVKVASVKAGSALPLRLAEL